MIANLISEIDKSRDGRPHGMYSYFSKRNG